VKSGGHPGPTAFDADARAGSSPDVTVSPELQRFLGRRVPQGKRGTDMKTMIAAAAIAIALMPLGASAQERVGDAALGALSGAVVLGPVGAVAGAVVGYSAGPSIASSWGL